MLCPDCALPIYYNSKTVSGENDGIELSCFGARDTLIAYIENDETGNLDKIEYVHNEALNEFSVKGYLSISNFDNGQEEYVMQFEEYYKVSNTIFSAQFRCLDYYENKYDTILYQYKGVLPKGVWRYWDAAGKLITSEEH